MTLFVVEKKKRKFNFKLPTRKKKVKIFTGVITYSCFKIIINANFFQYFKNKEKWFFLLVFEIAIDTIINHEEQSCLKFVIKRYSTIGQSEA